MTQSKSAIFVQTSAGSGEDPGQRLRVALASAFPAVDEAGEVAALPPAGVDAHLLEVVDAPAPLHFEELEKEVSRHRRLLARGVAAVPVTALISVGGAILFHLMLAGAFAALAFFVARTAKPGGGDVSGGGGGEAGGSAMGYVVMGDDPVGEAVKNVNMQPLNLPPPPPPLTPPPSKAPAASRQVALQQMLSGNEDPLVIGMPAGDRDMGQLKVTPPRLPKPAVVPPEMAPAGMQIEPPSEQTTVVNPKVALGNGSKTDVPASAHGRAHASAAGPGIGADSGDNDDDEPVISLLRDGGHGGGHGGGEGLDRGVSGADNPEPQVLDAPLPTFSMWTTPPRRNPAFTVLVKADGAIGKVSVAESSGQQDLDDYLRTWILDHWKYSPAMVHGKYVDMETRFTIKLTAK